MRSLALLVWAWLAQLTLTQPGQAVSYFGGSFCHIQAVQDLATFRLSLQFRTSRGSGLLLMAAGVKDYLALELHNGRLKARMDLGFGQMELLTPLSLHLNQFQEHTVVVTLQDSKFALEIDGLYSDVLPLTNSQEELNIDIGIYLADVDDLDRPYIDKSMPPLRGCMSDVKFVSHNFDILASAPVQCVDTKEACSSEFEAGEGETTSFVSPDSFVSFPTWRAANPQTLEFLMKTTIEDALLLLHTGQPEQFIALGLVQGCLKAVMGTPSTVISLDFKQVKLEDDQWHRVRVHLNQSALSLTVDSQFTSTRLRGFEGFELMGNLYLGGIPAKKKDAFRDSEWFLRMEEDISSESFIGCFGEIKVNERITSLQYAVATKDVHVKCEGEDYDYSAYDEESDTVTTANPIPVIYESDPNERHCFPTKDTPEAFRNITKLLDVTPLLVSEGGEAFLDVRNLQPTFDLTLLGLRQSQIIFTLQQDPLYGEVEMNVNNKRTKKFTLLDVANKKIKYLHSGNERHGDKIQLEVVTLSYSPLPECLKNPQPYILPVEVMPVNDIPQLSSGDLPVAKNGRTRLSPTMIKIMDSDTRCDELMVTVTSRTTKEGGYLEDSKDPERMVSRFSCRQLKDGNIYYIHRGGNVSDLTLQVSDGQSLSPPSTFHVTLVQPTLSLVTNTGLLISQGGNATLGIQQLAVSATPKNADVVYNVTQPLRFGELRLLTSRGTLRQVTSFHQSDLEEGNLRYVCTDSSSREDTVVERVLFDVRLAAVVLRDNTFIVKILPSAVRVAKMVPLEVDNGSQKAIRQTELEAVVKEKNVALGLIKYVLLKAPTLGTLQLMGRELNEGDSFTQQDIWHAYLNYKVRVGRNADMEDEFGFQVFAEKQSSPVYTYPIKIKADPDVPVLLNERLVVPEGGEHVLNKKHLWIHAQNSTDFVYKVSKDPVHGRLFRESPPGMPRFEGAIKVFSNEDLLLDRLVYKHDGSESSEDEFSFSVFGQAKGGGHMQEAASGVFRVSIQSKNDHTPYRVVDKTFSVVRNGQRLLTTEDILFHDDDSGFNDTQLVYLRVGILSGNIVSAEDTSQPLFRFTQADLRDKKVLFIHHGADRERFQLQVSDGQHKTTALMQVQAGEPYLRVVNNTMLVIDHGDTKTLDSSQLSVESNLDIRDQAEIRYEVTVPPNVGSIIVSGIEASAFTQEDLRKGVVSYQHDDSSLKSKDSFGFRVECKGLSVEGTFRIKVFKQGHLSEPQVLHNDLVVSYEGEHTVINEEHLKVEQDDILPSEMLFTIKEHPRMGHVVMLTNGSSSLDYVHSFSQEDVDQARILYVATATQGRDFFTVDVSNGFTALEDLRVLVDIVPRHIPVEAANFTLSEGGSVALRPDILNITHPFYSSANIDFMLLQSPEHGSVRYYDNNDDVTFFTWNEVKQGVIFYTHDGSETTNDSFVLSATSYELRRSSLPIAFSVSILPVNDEPPRLLTNTGLELLPGEEAEISASMLSTQDLDTPPAQLVYTIDRPPNGIVALKSAPERSVRNFTQEHINKGEVMFLHSGSQSGSFSFIVTDGEFNTPRYRFTVTARELSINMEAEGELLVFPGTRQAITADILKASISDDGDEVTYTVLRAPRLGRLISANVHNQFEEISGFTQAELDSGSVYYQHQMPSEPFWAVRDSVELLISSPPAQDLEHTLPVTVSFQTETHGNSSLLWRNKGLKVLPGQKEVVGSSILDASNLLQSVSDAERAHTEVLFEVQKFPSHGELILGGEPLPRDTPNFSQQDVDNNELEYLNQDTKSSSDSFSLVVRLSSGSKRPQAASPTVIKETFHINVQQSHFHPPQLVTGDLLLEVLQGSTVPITKKHVNTIDEDNAPNEVVFIVTKGPGNGQLVNTKTRERLTRFTQADINNGQVAFISDGSLANGFLEFTLTDGKHTTESHSLHIGILARVLLLAKAEEIQVRQGDDETVITESMLKASTGSPNEEEILYKITNVPKYAAVMVDRQTTTAFTQKQIREGRVSVRFIKSTSPRDSVALLARSKAANVSTVLNITVTPLVKLPSNPVLPRASTVLVDHKLLDASALANKTKVSPTFTVSQQPRGARFVRVGGETEGQPLSAFTEKDINDGRVGLELLNHTGAGQEDNRVRFLLTAHGVPPAEGSLAFRTAPYNASEVYNATLLKYPQHSDGSSQRKPVVPRRGNIWAILIPIFVILLLLLLAAFLAYYLVRRNKTGKHNVQTVASKPKNGEVNQETFRKTDAANSIAMSTMESKEADPELLQHCRTTNPPLKKNQYWV